MMLRPGLTAMVHRSVPALLATVLLVFARIAAAGEHGFDPVDSVSASSETTNS